MYMEYIHGHGDLHSRSLHGTRSQVVAMFKLLVVVRGWYGRASRSDPIVLLEHLNGRVVEIVEKKPRPQRRTGQPMISR